MDTLSLTKEAKINNGKKTIPLTNGAGKTGQPPVKYLTIFNNNFWNMYIFGPVIAPFESLP